MSDRMIITNGSVVTMNDAGDVLFGGAVAIEGDRIVDVGETAEVLARHPAGVAPELLELVGVDRQVVRFEPAPGVLFPADRDDAEVLAV